MLLGQGVEMIFTTTILAPPALARVRYIHYKDWYKIWGGRRIVSEEPSGTHPFMYKSEGIEIYMKCCWDKEMA